MVGQHYTVEVTIQNIYGRPVSDTMSFTVLGSASLRDINFSYRDYSYTNNSQVQSVPLDLVTTPSGLSIPDLGTGDGQISFQLSGGGVVSNDDIPVVPAGQVPTQNYTLLGFYLTQKEDNSITLSYMGTGASAGDYTLRAVVNTSTSVIEKSTIIKVENTNVLTGMSFSQSQSTISLDNDGFEQRIPLQINTTPSGVSLPDLGIGLGYLRVYLQHPGTSESEQMLPISNYAQTPSESDTYRGLSIAQAWDNSLILNYLGTGLEPGTYKILAVVAYNNGTIVNANTTVAVNDNTTVQSLDFGQMQLNYLNNNQVQNIKLNPIVRPIGVPIPDIGSQDGQISFTISGNEIPMIPSGQVPEANNTYNGFFITQGEDGNISVIYLGFGSNPGSVRFEGKINGTSINAYSTINLEGGSNAITGISIGNQNLTFENNDTIQRMPLNLAVQPSGASIPQVGDQSGQISFTILGHDVPIIPSGQVPDINYTYGGFFITQDENMSVTLSYLGSGSDVGSARLELQVNNSAVEAYSNITIRASSNALTGLTLQNRTIAFTNSGQVQNARLNLVTQPAGTPIPQLGSAAGELLFEISGPGIEGKMVPVIPSGQVPTPESTLNGFYVSQAADGAVTFYYLGSQATLGNYSLEFSLNTPEGESFNGTAIVTITVGPTADVPSDFDFHIQESEVYLTTNSQIGSNTAQLHALVIPATFSPKFTWSSLNPQVATVSENGEVTGINEGKTEIVLAYNHYEARCFIIVTNNAVVGNITVSATSPDYFTVKAENVQINPALNKNPERPQEVRKVSMFTWSGLQQNDMDAKVATNSSQNTWEYTFPVNDNAQNNYYYDASNIKINVYASDSLGSDGDLIGVLDYNNVTNTTAYQQNVAYIAYSQNIGFNKPTVFDGAIAGTTGEGLQMEGLRVSSNINGVNVVTSVHAADIGWMEAVGNGSYAGTMHENRQIEAIRCKLEGPNAANYYIRYRAHCQDIGWQEWVSTELAPNVDEIYAGTVGKGLQLEAVEIEILPR